MTAFACGDVSTETLGRYVAGTLEDVTAKPFEEHLVGCSRCQSRLREAVALRKVLRASEASTPRAPAARWRRNWIPPLAVAAGIGMIWFAAARTSPLARLGDVAVAPPLAVMPVRTDGDSTAALVERGLDAYRAGRFGEAALALGRADALQPLPTTRYYRGAALLMNGDPQGAIEALTLPASVDGVPLAVEARFLLAKAWLRLGLADSALAQLKRIPGTGHPLAPTASALAESVRMVIR